jgi:hypothetical protein
MFGFFLKFGKPDALMVEICVGDLLFIYFWYIYIFLIFFFTSWKPACGPISRQSFCICLRFIVCVYWNIIHLFLVLCMCLCVETWRAGGGGHAWGRSRACSSLVFFNIHIYIYIYSYVWAQDCNKQVGLKVI